MSTREIYKEARNAVQNLIPKEEKAYFKEKLRANTANPKKLWETLEQIVCRQKITFLQYLSPRERRFNI